MLTYHIMCIMNITRSETLQLFTTVHKSLIILPNSLLKGPVLVLGYHTDKALVKTI